MQYMMGVSQRVISLAIVLVYVSVKSSHRGDGRGMNGGNLAGIIIIIRQSNAVYDRCFPVCDKFGDSSCLCECEEMIHRQYGICIMGGRYERREI